MVKSGQSRRDARIRFRIRQVVCRQEAAHAHTHARGGVGSPAAGKRLTDRLADDRPVPVCVATHSCTGPYAHASTSVGPARAE